MPVLELYKFTGTQEVINEEGNRTLARVVIIHMNSIKR